MKMLTLFLVTVMLSLVTLPSPAPADSRLHYSKMFNPGTVETVKGEVTQVGRFVAGNGRDVGVKMVLNTGRENIPVILGPQRFLEQKAVKIEPKKRVTLTGSRIMVQGRPHLIATEIQGDVRIKLRDPNGRPAWAVGDDWHVH